MGETPVLAAALAGVPAALQGQGVWQGRRQLFVKFAGPAETATMYTSDALAREVMRTLARTSVHSIAISGPETLGGVDFLAAALVQVHGSAPPVMLDTDGQRPEALVVIRQYLKLVQVSIDTPLTSAVLERAVETLSIAAQLGLDHALVILGRDETSDADYLQIVAQARGVSADVAIVIHPSGSAERASLERRWSALMEQAAKLHRDVRFALRLHGPAVQR